MQFSPKSVLAMLALTALAPAAHAQVFSDTTSTFTTIRPAESAPLTYFSNVATSTVITNFSVYNQMTVPGNLEFLIFNNVTQTLLYNSGPIAYGADAGLTWKQSPALTFTLVAGQTYNFGALSDVEANYGYNISGDLTQNGLTSAQRNSNVGNFGSPTFIGDGSARIPIILSAAPAAVPEPAPALTFAVAGMGLGGLVIAARRRKAFSAL